jgi:hypothetical protein
VAHADIAQACFDGTLNVWNTSSNLARPDKSCETAHAKNTETTGVAFARDGYRIASRGGDDTVKCEYPSSFRRARLMPMGIVWDLRSIRKPVAVVQDMGNIYPETNIIFSPDDRSILTGLPGSKGGKGAMVFLSGDDLSEQRRIPIGEGSVVRVLWHSRINQVSGSCLLHCVVIDTLRSLRPCHQAPSTSSTPTLGQDAPHDPSRRILLHRRPQAGHLHPRSPPHVRRQEVWGESAPEGEARKEVQAHGACQRCWQRWKTGWECHGRIRPDAVLERGSEERGCE